MAYVYLHTRLDTNEIFYVGIGNSDTDNFRRSRAKNRNKHWNNIVKKAGYRIDVVYRNISREKAIEIEIKLIKLYGRSDLGLGNLVNMTDGGEGAVGTKHTEETKHKLSEFNIGKKHTKESKAKMSEAQIGKKKSTETKLNISNSLKGKKHSDETKQKISESQKGNSNRLGIKHSDESKAKMSKKILN